MSCVMGLGNVITLISCENSLYYKKPIQYLYLKKEKRKKKACVMRTNSTYRGKIKD